MSLWLVIFVLFNFSWFVLIFLESILFWICIVVSCFLVFVIFNLIFVILEVYVSLCRVSVVLYFVLEMFLFFVVSFVCMSLWFILLSFWILRWVVVNKVLCIWDGVFEGFSVSTDSSSFFSLSLRFRVLD